MSRKWLDPLRGKPRDYVRAVDKVCLMHSVHPIAAALLLQFRDTPEGQRFMEGKDIKPQFEAPKKTQAWARMSLDWLEDE